jgi:acetyl-CoA carboxylase carboxyltransferase component
MGPEGAIKIIYRKQLPDKADSKSVNAFADDYRRKFANPYVAAGRGYIDDVIEPQETRPRLIHALETIIDKREPRLPRKHGNPPL